MKKLIICLILVNLFCANKASAFDYRPYMHYLSADYVGTPYHKAALNKRPFLLIFATPKDPFLILRLLPTGKLVYDKYRDKYDFCITNFDSKANEHLVNAYNVTSLPVMYIVDPYYRTAYRVNQKCFDNQELLISELDKYMLYRKSRLN